VWVAARNGAGVTVERRPQPEDLAAPDPATRAAAESLLRPPNPASGPVVVGAPHRPGDSAGANFVAGVLVAFCLMHALLFAFQRSATNHLYFALISGLGAVMSWPLFGLNQLSQHWMAILALLVLRLFQLLFQPLAAPPGRGLIQAAVVAVGVLVARQFGLPVPSFLAVAAQVASVFEMFVCAYRIVRIAAEATRAQVEGARSIGAGFGMLLLLSTLPFAIPFSGGLSFSQLGVVLFFGATSVHLPRLRAHQPEARGAPSRTDRREPPPAVGQRRDRTTAGPTGPGQGGRRGRERSQIALPRQHES